MRNKKMTFPEYLHEMPLNRIIYRKRVIKHAKKVFTQFYTIKKAIAEPIPAGRPQYRLLRLPYALHRLYLQNSLLLHTSSHYPKHRLHSP